MPEKKVSQSTLCELMSPSRNTFNITYDPVDVFVVVAGEYRVRRGIELIQGTWRHFECHRKLDTRPVMLASIKSLSAARTFGEVFMILQQSGENNALVFRRKANGVNFLLLLQRNDELIGILQRGKSFNKRIARKID